MSPFFKLKSHSDKLLKKHLENVGRLSKEIVNSKSIETREILAEVAYLIGIVHDFGKSTSYFQKWLNNGERTKYAQHGFLSALVGYLAVRNFLSNIQKLDELWFLPGIAWIVINKHHGNLRDILNKEALKLKNEEQLELIGKQLKDILNNSATEVDEFYKLLGYSEISKLLNEIRKFRQLAREIYKDIKKMCMSSFKEISLKYYFWTLFFYSILLDVDKLDASRRSDLPERMDIPSDIVDSYKKIRFKEPKTKVNIIREKAYNEVISKIDEIDLNQEKILPINLPTGCGKTLTGLSFALKLREKVAKQLGFTPKIIYSLPFLSIIDQNAKIFEDILKLKYGKIPSNLFLIHHHLADIEYKEIRDGELDIEELSRSLLLTEGWHSEIVITTFVQLFHSLITNKNRATRKFHNIINSIIILDEIQSIPHKYWLLINKILNYLAENFNCWIILMTATAPLIFGYDEIKDLVTNRDEYFNIFNRVIFTFNLNPINFEDFKHEIFNRILNDDSNMLVVLNTINSCKELYEFLKEKIMQIQKEKKNIEIDDDGIVNFLEIELINLSTHILPNYRLRRIDRIKDKDNKKRKIIVTTQLVEAGVDISVDVVYRDFAPLDCLIQTAGRCNRNNEKDKGQVNIVVLRDDKRPYNSYIYDPTLINATKEVIRKFGKMVQEKDFALNSVEKYYKLMTERGSKDVSKNLFESLTKMDFSEISKFNLIQEKLPSISIFVEIDEIAENVREKMEDIVENKKEKFELKLELLELKKQIAQYTIQVGFSKKLENMILNLKPIDNLEEFRYIKKSKLKEYYDIDSGIKTKDAGISGYIV